MLEMSTWRRKFQSLMYPAALVIWVICGVVLICQYKGMIPWFGEWPEAIVVLVTVIPPLWLVMYVLAQVIKMISPK